mmetsp:Transcript_18104/g.43287  ORF Transcript_18104/g.43287 Transcript_18104/m.43287 type:complete len:116 (-) Transcript_18104:1328-1675(-)
MAGGQLAGEQEESHESLFPVPRSGLTCPRPGLGLVLGHAHARSWPSLCHLDLGPVSVPAQHLSPLAPAVSRPERHSPPSARPRRPHGRRHRRRRRRRLRPCRSVWFSRSPPLAPG